MFEWDDARYFLAIHRTGSLSAAGRQLGVNQSTVGRRLAVLEERLGARLFFRTPDGYAIAPGGERLLPRAERMEDEAIAITREIAGQETSLTGTVRLTGSDFFSARIVTPLLAKLHERFPAMTFELVADVRALNLTKREADMALRIGRPNEPQLIARRLSDFASAPYASAEYLARRGKAQPPDFEGHDFIAYDDPMRGVPEGQWVEQRARRGGGRVVLRSISSFVQCSAAVSGMGVVLLPCYIGDAEPALVRLAPPDPGVERQVWLVLHRDMQHSARVRACADALAEGVRELEPILTGKSARKRKG